MQKEEKIVSSFLSQGNVCFYDDYQCPIEFQGIVYPSVRHAVLSLKTDAVAVKRQIAGKLLPLTLQEFDATLPVPAYWTEEFILEWLRKLTYRKFTENTVLKKKLCETGEDEIVDVPEKELDDYGLISNEKHENYLGKILMEVRELLKTT